MKVVFVTGGAGYIGSHTCKALKAAGYFPVSIDNLSQGNSSAVKWGPLHIGDIADTAFLHQLWQTYQPMAIMHFAASAIVGQSLTSPSLYYENNVYGSLRLLQKAKDEGCPVIFSSTCATYGDPLYLPIDEKHIQAPINPYGFTKYVVEKMLRDFQAAYGLRYVSLRYFNAAGADPEKEIGEDHQPETHLIPLALDVALGKKKSLCLFGNDYATGDGSAVRDYVHVQDLAEAHIKALEYLVNNKTSCAFNLGTGKGHSVMDIIRRAEIITGRRIDVTIKARRVGDAPVLVAKADKSRQELAWHPRLSDIDTILETAWQWAVKKSSWTF